MAARVKNRAAGVSETTIAAGLARGLFEFAVSRGADAAALAARAGIGPADLRDPDRRVAYAKYIALTRAGEALCNDPALALHYGEAVDMAEISIVGLIMNASETMLHAFAQMKRFGRLALEAEEDEAIQLALDGEQMWLVDTRANARDFPEQTEELFARLTCGPRRFLPRPHVLEVQFRHAAPAWRAEHDRIFQCPVRFGAVRNAMRMEPSLAMHKVALQPHYAFGVLSAHAEKLLQELEASKTVRGRVESLLLPVLHTGEASMDAVADTMGLSRATLLRKLKAEGVTFEKVLDDLRHTLALHYLRGRKASVNETAYLVGFSDPGTFSRAFKRWTGASPRTMRAATAKNDADVA
jgi:AraC-like DNA-binding protein